MDSIYRRKPFNIKKLGNNFVTQLVKQLRLHTTFDVTGCNITDQGVDMIAGVLLETISPTKLDFFNTTLNVVKDFKITGALKKTSSLEVLNINNTSNELNDEFSDDTITAISSNHSIEKLNFSHNRLSYTRVLNIAKAISDNIVELDFSSNFIACDNIFELATVFAKFAALEELNLSQNFLNLTSIIMIARCFRYHCTLRKLDLSGNLISFPSACEFIVDIILSVNQKLVSLKVFEKNIRPRSIDNSSPYTIKDESAVQFPLLDTNNKLIKVTELCPVNSDDIASYYVDHDGGVFYNQCHNFAIVIPPGCISQGDCVEIKGTAYHFVSDRIPDGFYPISSYFWISANYTFKAPVYFIMSNYVKVSNPSDISNLHVLHKCYQNSNNNKNDDPLMSIVSNGVYFDNEIGYCVLATTHFCSYCQAKSVRHISEYLLACYCTFDESSESHIAEVCFCPSNSECRKVCNICFAVEM